ncbi:hypothetical protein PR202_ga17815 [Eleusine coracana subsp. coracana]|uniref:Uncharacterized protein n=1 Tax=Eleusine coracana subsp. coracana TaxID=191504 RepID=A0AAV5CRA9_ELECO|nr:hypothetical protein PR202_ga17815 [Eleusine coracana subsp. coracana]
MAAANTSSGDRAEAREAMDRGRVIFDFTCAEIRGDLEDRNPPIFLPRLQMAASPHVAIDMGGTLIKLAYTASCGDGGEGTELRFATFENHRLDDCFEIIRAEGLVPCKGASFATALNP